MIEQIAVIVPVYNVEDYLEDCLESIVEQTYINLLIICINDGSTDSSLNILEQIASNDERVLIISQENLGLSSARNLGLSIARKSKAKYITFVDSDDLLSPVFIEESHKQLIENNADFVMSFPTRELESLNKVLSNSNDVKVKEYEKYEEIYFSTKEIPYSHTAWGKLYELSLCEGIEFPEGIRYEDGPFTLKLFEKIKKVVIISKNNYLYRVNLNSITNDLDFRSSFMDIIKALELRHDILKPYQSCYINSLKESVFLMDYFIMLLLHTKLAKQESNAWLNELEKSRHEYLVELNSKPLKILHFNKYIIRFGLFIIMYPYKFWRFKLGKTVLGK